MASARKVTIEFLGNNKDLDRAMDQSASRAGRFGSALKKAGKVAALGLAAGASIAGKALFEMTKAAVADEAAQAKLANTLRKAAGATDAQIAQTEDWITKQGELYGVTDDELRPALAKLATATGDVEEAQRLAALAMDVSAGSGKSLDSVTTALQKAQNGSVGGLSKLGVATKNAAGETLSFEQIQANLAKVHAGAAATSANTLEGKMNRLKVQLTEAGEAIGAKLIPVVSQMVDWFVAKGLPAIQNFGGWIQTNLVPIFVRIGEVIRSVLGGMSGDTSGTLAGIRSTIADFVTIVRALWDRFGADITAFARATWQNVKQVIGGALKVIQGIFKVFASIIKGDWSGAWEGIKLIVRGAWQVISGIVRQLANTVTSVLKVAWSALKAIASAAWDGVKTAFSNGIGKVMDLVRAVPGKIKDAFGAAGTLLKTIGSQIIDGLVAGIRAAGQKVMDAVNAIINKIPKFIRDKMGISSPSKVTEYLGRMIGEGLAKGVDKGGKKAEEALKKRIEGLKTQLSTAKDMFAGLRDSVAGSFTSGLFDAEDSGSFLANLNSTRGTLGALKDAFKTLTGWGLKPGFLAQLFQSGNAGLILDLAKNKATAVEAGSVFGGITAASTDLGGMVAQNQYGDEIKALQDKIKDLEDKGGKGRVGDTFNITIPGVTDTAGAAREIEKVLTKLKRVEGRTLSFV